MNHRATSSKAKVSKGPETSKGRDLFIPAFFVEPPNLDLYAALQNLMWYAIECLNSLPSITGRNALMAQHFFKSISLLSMREKECAASLDPQSNKLFVRFLDDARATEVLLRGFLDEAALASRDDRDLVPKSAAATIAARATYLQWLLVCLSGELRMPLSQPAHDSPQR